MQALSIAQTINSPWLMLDALTGVGLLHAQEGRSAEAYELSVLVLRMPVTHSIGRILLERLRSDLERRLTADEIAAATERGQTSDVKELTAELLAAWSDKKRAVGGYISQPPISMWCE